MLHTLSAFCACPFQRTPPLSRPYRYGFVSTSPAVVTAPYAKAPKRPSRSSKRPRTGGSGSSSSSSSSSNKTSSNAPPTTPTPTPTPISKTATGFQLNKTSLSNDADKPFTYDDDDFGMPAADEADEDYLPPRRTNKKGARDTFTNTSSTSTLSTTTKTTAREREQLGKLDKNGISMEIRLREEILHPLRKPKLTLFGTLAFSATLGFFFATGRYFVEKDDLLQVLKNVGIDALAVALFGYLAWREVQFGRRSLNSLAGLPQARDLPIRVLKDLSSSTRDNNDANNGGKNSSKAKRVGNLLTQVGHIVVVVGKSIDVVTYLERVIQPQLYNSIDSMYKYSEEHPAIITFITDGDAKANTSRQVDGVTAVAAIDADDGRGKDDWIAWLGDAIPPKRNVALFRLRKETGANKSGSEYVVIVDDPELLPMPKDVKRMTEVEV